MYKAKIDIGGYKTGEEVPAAKAEIWASMYLESPVEKIGEKIESEKLESNGNSGSILEDYLARNKNVTIKNIGEDDLSKENLEELFKLEKAGKKRNAVISAIEKRLKSIN